MKSTLTPKQRLAVPMAAQGLRSDQIAKRVGVRPEAVRQWRQKPTFQAEVNQILTDIQNETGERLRRLCATAVSTLETVMQDAEAPGTARVAAAVKVLELCQAQPQQIGPTDPEHIAMLGETQKLMIEIAARLTGSTTR